jgi:hypothetical protein
MTIHRYPNLAGLMRGPNMQTKWCNSCRTEKTHGFWLFDNEVMAQAVFACDDCLATARKAEKNLKGNQ